MSGTQIGGIHARDTNRKRHGADFYANIGAIGGKLGHNGGFGSKNVGKDGLTGLERARIAGKRGGTISRRGKKVVKNSGAVVELTKEQADVLFPKKKWYKKFV